MQLIKSYASPDVLKVNIASFPLPIVDEMAATYINTSGQKLTKWRFVFVFLFFFNQDLHALIFYRNPTPPKEDCSLQQGEKKRKHKTKHSEESPVSVAC